MTSSLPSPVELFNTRNFDLPLDQTKLNDIASLVSQGERRDIELVEVVYVDEDEIVDINKEYLGRDYVTDIISFSYHEENVAIEGTLFCCAPRIQEQAQDFSESPEREFARIFIHGLLHLAGHEDQTKSDKKLMTDLENKYLSESGY